MVRIISNVIVPSEYCRLIPLKFEYNKDEVSDINISKKRLKTHEKQTHYTITDKNYIQNDFLEEYRI